MAKCIDCGRKGLFLKLDTSGRCRECSYRFRKLEDQQKIIEQQKIAEEARRKKEEAQQKSIFESTIVKLNPIRIINRDLIRKCNQKFIAIDLETTGLSSSSDRIIQLSAATFINGNLCNTFSTYINPGIPIPRAASSVNNITDEMVSNAPEEKKAIKDFIHYLGDSPFKGEELFIAHNADFDINFLKNALKRSGINACLTYFDTLYASRKILGQKLKSKKLNSVADFFNIRYAALHNASIDSALCGEIFIRLMQTKENDLLEKYSNITKLEEDICIWFKEMLEKKGCDTSLLCFNLTSYLTVYCYSAVLKFKAKAKKPYVIVSGRHPLPDGLSFFPCTKSEGEGFLRYYFNDVSELEPLSNVLKDRYERVYVSTMDQIKNSDQERFAADFIYDHLTV